jgi:hypothetical protein
MKWRKLARPVIVLGLIVNRQHELPPQEPRPWREGWTIMLKAVKPPSLGRAPTCRDRHRRRGFGQHRLQMPHAIWQHGFYPNALAASNGTPRVRARTGKPRYGGHWRTGTRGPPNRARPFNAPPRRWKVVTALWHTSIPTSGDHRSSATRRGRSCLTSLVVLQTARRPRHGFSGGSFQSFLRPF